MLIHKNDFTNAQLPSVWKTKCSTFSTSVIPVTIFQL